MVTYSFQQRFVQPIRVGLSRVQLSFDCRPKRQTIRAEGRKRHSRPGETMQLYFRQRHLNKGGFKIGDAQCVDVRHIRFDVQDLRFAINGIAILSRDEREEFARDDGFDDLIDMQGFWLKHHPGIERFDGLVFNWQPMP